MVNTHSTSSTTTKHNHKSKRNTKPNSRLKSTRPPLLKPHQSTSSLSLSSKATRNIIRSHHTLRKQLVQAEARTGSGREDEVTRIKSQLENLGGLETYQLASSLGQSKLRGGDSSKVLVDWIRSLTHVERGEDGVFTTTTSIATSGHENVGKKRKLRILEIGALSTKNALNNLLSPGPVSQDGNKPRWSWPGAEIRRIDLKSREKGIEEIDFMDLEIPLSQLQHLSTYRSRSRSNTQLKDEDIKEDDNGYYDIISLSLVLNFVPDPISRGEMLRRTTLFTSPNHQVNSIYPCLFLVLPLACVTNSRYLDESRLNDIMESLDYMQIKVKHSKKLYYSLWRFNGIRHDEEEVEEKIEFEKKEINSGKGRNNFCIVLKKVE